MISPRLGGLLRRVRSKFQTRGFAREAKKPFEAPPDPPASTIDKIRWPIVAVTFGGIAYIIFLPANDHGLFEEKMDRPAN